MESDFFSVHTWNAYKGSMNIDRKFTTQKEFVELFTSIDWSLGTVYSYPNYPFDPPSHELFIFDLKRGKSLKFSTVICNDWDYEFYIHFGMYQKEGEEFKGVVETFETTYEKEDVMVRYINGFCKGDYSAILQTREESGVYHTAEKTFKISPSLE